MIAHAVDRYADLFEFLLGTSKLIQTVSDFNANVIAAPTAALQRSRSVADLDQQQFMMRPA